MRRPHRLWVVVLINVALGVLTLALDAAFILTSVPRKLLIAGAGKVTAPDQACHKPRLVRGFCFDGERLNADSSHSYIPRSSNPHHLGILTPASRAAHP